MHEVVRRLGNMGIPASMVGEIVESRTVYASSNRAWQIYSGKPKSVSVWIAKG